jgi:hypothetical protein
VLLFVAPIPASADTTDVALGAADLVIVRPVGLALCVASTAVWFATVIPTSLLGVDAADSAEYLVKRPIAIVTDRPLGVF